MSREELLLQVLRTIEKEPRITQSTITRLTTVKSPNHIILARGLLERTGRGIYRIKNTATIGNYTLVFGLEIETEMNGEEIGVIDRAGYHSSQFNNFSKYFCAETDCSLRTNNFIGRAYTAEFVSEPLPYDKVVPALEDFKLTMERRAKMKNLELYRLLCFNYSTGAHIHISVVKNGAPTPIKFKDKTIVLPGKPVSTSLYRENIRFFKRIAAKIKQRLKREMPEFYPRFQQDYFRSYAKKMPNTPSPGRNFEFNMNTDYDTIEWRSSHLHGIKTWKDFINYYAIVTSVFQEEFIKEFKKKNAFEQTKNLTLPRNENPIINHDNSFIAFITNGGERYVQY